MTDNSKIVYLASEGMGWHWGHPIVKPLLERAFPECVFKLDSSKFSFQVRSHFIRHEPYLNENSKPYLTWSGEAYTVKLKSYPPILDIRSDGPLKFRKENDVPIINIPMIVISYVIYSKKGYNFPHYTNKDRPYTLAYCYSNPVPYRENFFKLARTKMGTQARSLGKCSNTEGLIKGGWQVEELFEAYSKYNFVMAFENCQKPGYITEKILSVFLSGAIPIYWGDYEIVNELFNPKAFIRMNDFKTSEECIDFIIELNNDEQKLNGYRNEPIFKDNVVPGLFRIEDFSDSYYQEVIEHLQKNLTF